MKIAFQGLTGSFSEYAAIELAKKEGLAGYELLPAATSMNVCHDVEKGIADYGVVAMENSIGGIVNETKEALSKGKFKIVSSVAVPISQCLFKKSADILDTDIKFVASHEQALNQCSNTLSQILPQIKKTKVEDTALAAKRLNDGTFKKDTAVICSKRAGELYQLCLIKEDIQDKAGNTTYFSLISSKKKSNSIELSKKDRILSWLYQGNALKFIIQAIIAIAIIGSYYLTSYWGWSPLRSALSLGTPFAAICLFLTSPHFRNWIDARRICGYWTYYVRPLQSEGFKVVQLEGLKRIVVIDLGQSGIHLNGWLCDSPVTKLFDSVIALATPAGKKRGCLMYRYRNSTHSPEGMDFDGIVCLEFYEKSGWGKINKMSGLYVNRQGDQGRLEFIRIEKEEYNRWIA